MNSLQLVLEYFENEEAYEDFQFWLESEKEIDGSEAELIIADLEKIQQP